MIDLTPEELDALTHWASHGQPGELVTERFVPDDDERARLTGFVAPHFGNWPDRFTLDQATLLLNGFPRGAMEDKWIIYSDDLTPERITTVHFHRSWTGQQVLSIDLELDDTGANCTAAAWEMDPGTVKNSSELFARTTFVEVCRWVLGMQPA